MSTYEKHLHLSLPAQGDTDWDEEINEDLKMIAEAICPGRVLFVAKNYVDGNFFHTLSAATDRQHFATIQGAIDYGEAEGWGDDSEGYTVLIAPGTYNENLAIGGNVCLSSFPGASGGMYGGGQVLINGDLTTLASVITIQPPDSIAGRVTLVGLTIDNRYNVDRSALAEIPATTPYAIYYKKQATTYGSSQNWFKMVDCHVRMQTWGRKNQWAAGIRVDGWVQVNIEGCQIQDLGYGGGFADLSFVRHLLHMEGDNASGYSNLVLVKRTDLSAQGDTPGSGNHAIFYADNRATITAAFSSWDQTFSAPSYEDGGTGSNSFVGIDNATEIFNYRNIEGLGALVQF